MIYYSLTLVATLILCLKFSTTYPMLDYAEARRFKNARTAFLALLPMTLLAAFRWNVGSDTLYYASYWQAYQAAKTGQNLLDFEFGFYLFLRIIGVFKLPYFWLLFVHTVIFMALVSYAIYKGSVWPAWSIVTFFLLFVYFDCNSSLRQSLAEGISLIAWAKMGSDKKSGKKDLQILLLFLLATLFHSTAWLNIPLYFVCKMKLRKNNYVLLLVFAILLTPALQFGLRAIMVLVAGNGYKFLGVAVINTIMTGVILIMCWVFYDQIFALNENAHMYLNLAACIFIMILNSGAMYLPFRVFDMLKIGYVFIVPCILRSITNRWNKLFINSFFVLAFGAWFFNQFFVQDSSTVNYQSVIPYWGYTYLP